MARRGRGKDSTSPATSSAARDASSDHGPETTRKMQLISWAYSDRISCSTAQNPTCGGTGGKRQGRRSQIQRNFGRKNRRNHLCNKRDRNQPRSQACKQQQPAHDLKSPDEGRGKVRKRDPQFCETANPLVRVDKLQQPFPEKHPSRHEPQKQAGFWTIGRRIH